MRQLAPPGAALACAAVLLTACGGNGSDSRPPDPDPGPVDIDLVVDLADYVGDALPYVGSYSEGYSIPSAADLTRFDTLADALIDGRLDTVRSLAADVNFELVRVVDTGAGNNELYCLREIVLRGQGLYCVDYDASPTHFISAPHPIYDWNTNVESIEVIRGIGARFYALSTTHRCANSAASVCSGTTSACGAAGPYKVSDPAHNVDAYFHHFGTAVVDSSPTTIAIQLHGCGSAACPANGDNADIVARVSAGTEDVLPPGELVNVLTAELNEELQSLNSGSALSCSEAVADKQLCGTTNPLGRYINGQPDPCQNPGTSFLGSRWLHVEQNRNLRRNDGDGDDITPELLIRAIIDTTATP
jgi:hypothetical protein